jgi:hypothetical protein
MAFIVRPRFAKNHWVLVSTLGRRLSQESIESTTMVGGVRGMLLAVPSFKLWL